ncbi:hypothetical protein LL06_00745 [Hoeflea sp. BAL378]|uniref:hypothetical protein n=1 Tax=Hoeflea sp. BAL378 TaxID=1547437 RepID=UPI000513CAC3|nr:hypothetical protein [Hoeflea sp. BAL378]KGF71157.1 hypothetical protein LL06_00745 [Hoeflea sp. BAL378]
MQFHKPADGAPQLRTPEGEAFPLNGKMIDPANRYYARLIAEGALEPAVQPTPSEPETHPDKPAHPAASKKEKRT